MFTGENGYIWIKPRLHSLELNQFTFEQSDESYCCLWNYKVREILSYDSMLTPTGLSPHCSVSAEKGLAAPIIILQWAKNTLAGLHFYRPITVLLADATGCWDRNSREHNTQPPKEENENINRNSFHWQSFTHSLHSVSTFTCTLSRATVKAQLDLLIGLLVPVYKRQERIDLLSDSTTVGSLVTLVAGWTFFWLAKYATNKVASS